MWIEVEINCQLEVLKVVETVVLSVFVSHARTGEKADSQFGVTCSGRENLLEVCVGFVTILDKTNEWRHCGRISSHEKSSCHPTEVYRNPSMRTGRAPF